MTCRIHTHAHTHTWSKQDTLLQITDSYILTCKEKSPMCTHTIALIQSSIYMSFFSIKKINFPIYAKLPQNTGKNVFACLRKQQLFPSCKLVNKWEKRVEIAEVPHALIVYNKPTVWVVGSVNDKGRPKIIVEQLEQSKLRQPFSVMYTPIINPSTALWPLELLLTLTQ